MPETKINLNSDVIGRSVLINGHTVHFVESNGKTPLLLVHGIGFSLYSMRNVFNTLADRGYKVIAVDLPGCGYSKADPKIKLSPDEIADTLHKLLESLKIKKTNIYAIAEGAIYALRLCQLFPEDVNSMVLASPGSLTRHYPAKYRHIATPIIGEVLVKLLERKHINKFFRWIMFDETGIIPTLERQTFQPFTQKEAKLGLLNLLRDYQDLHVFSNLSNIFCPVKLIWGDYDAGHPVNMSKLFLKKIEGSSLSIINNSGHLVHEERPNMVCDIIERFIAYNS